MVTPSHEAPRKRIVLLSDGTGNSASSQHKTNVWRLYQAIDQSPESNQIAYYDNGVGTSSFTPLGIIGKVFGLGLAKNVRDLYKFLCLSYHQGDEIFAFGFSRGAFTIRVTMALIAHQGIVDRTKVKNNADLDRLIKAAYREFRKSDYREAILSWVFKLLPRGWAFLKDGARRRAPYDPNLNLSYNSNNSGEDCSDTQTDHLITFVGVWDTVEAYGAPIDELTRAWNRVVFPLTTTDLNCSKRIAKACHALALDEQRLSFEPTLWNEKNQQPAISGSTNQEQVTQVWFPGVHANVGGGYPDDTLALVSLIWMMDESKKKCLQFDFDLYTKYKSQANWNGPLINNRAGLGTFYRFAPRHLDMLCHQQPYDTAGIFSFLPFMKGTEVSIKSPKLHHSIFKRIKNSGSAYAPINIPKKYSIVDSEGNLVEQHLPADRSNAKEPQIQIETNAQGTIRRHVQGHLWDSVWRLKAMHALTVALVFGFIVFPYLASPVFKGIDNFLDSIFGTGKVLIHALPDYLSKISQPQFIGDWGARYTEFPYYFVLFISAILAVIAWGKKMKRSMESQMQSYWSDIIGKPITDEPAQAPKARKSHDSYISDSGALVRTKRHHIVAAIRGFLELGVTLLLLVFVVVPLLSYVCFHFLQISGAGCSTTDKKDSTLYSEKMCNDTGHDVREGGIYKVRITINGQNKNKKDSLSKGSSANNSDIKVWKDRTIAADFNGWISARKRSRFHQAGHQIDGTPPPLWIHSLTLYRRHLLTDWHQPILRIGDKLNATQVITPYGKDGVAEFATADHHCGVPDKNTPLTDLCMVFKANRSGRVYTYLNDAIFFLPSVSFFYNNNHGSAEVIFTELIDDK